MLEKADAKDKIYEDNLERIEQEFEKTSVFKKIWEMNSTKFLIIPTIILTAMSGIAQPIFAIIFSKIMGILTAPMDMTEVNNDKGYVKNKVSTLCGYVLCIVAMIFIGTFGGKLCSAI
jgi:hypothetical protein